MTTSDGFNIGANPVETISPGGSATYTWYAGRVGRSATGTPEYTPMEFGAISLAPADPLMQHNFGLVGGLIVEPEGFKFEADENSRLSGTVTAGTTSFRESVVVVQDDLAALRTSDSTHLLPGVDIQFPMGLVHRLRRVAAKPLARIRRRGTDQPRPCPAR